MNTVGNLDLHVEARRNHPAETKRPAVPGPPSRRHRHPHSNSLCTSQHLLHIVSPCSASLRCRIRCAFIDAGAVPRAVYAEDTSTCRGSYAGVRREMVQIVYDVANSAGHAFSMRSLPLLSSTHFQGFCPWISGKRPGGSSHAGVTWLRTAAATAHQGKAAYGNALQAGSASYSSRLRPRDHSARPWYTRHRSRGVFIRESAANSSRMLVRVTP